MIKELSWYVSYTRHQCGDGILHIRATSKTDALIKARRKLVAKFGDTEARYCTINNVGRKYAAAVG